MSTRIEWLNLWTIFHKMSFLSKFELLQNWTIVLGCKKGTEYGVIAQP